MSEEHAYGHRTDFDIEFDNITKRELWELYTLARKKLEIKKLTSSDKFVEAVRSHYGDFEPPTSYELWVRKEEHDKLIQAERTAHEETKKRLEELARMNQEILDDKLTTEKRLEESEAKIKYLLERETELESQLNELNIERLKPFVLKSEMENMKSIMQMMIDERQERLEELEDAINAIAYKKNNNKFGIMRRDISDDSELFKAIQNSRERRLLNKAGEFIDKNGGEAMG